MSRYGLNSLLYRARTDAEYRQRFIANPDAVIAQWEISPEERTALLKWDVQQLNHMGVYLHIAIGLSNIMKSSEGNEEFRYSAEELSAANKKTSA